MKSKIENPASQIVENTDRKPLRGGDEQFRMMVEGVTDYAIFMLDTQGRVVSWNLGAENLKGYKAEEIVGQHFARFYPKDDVAQGKPMHELETAAAEGRFEDEGWRVRKDGSQFWANVNITALRDGKGQLCGFAKVTRDITEHRRVERQHALLSEILVILNNTTGLPDMIREVLSAIKRETGFDAVGIRLKSGDDFPYFSQDGFSNDFLLNENTLVARDGDGDICRNEDGSICLECTCGLVISGKTDPANPLFTPGGSCWTNNSFPLLDLPGEQDPRLHPRNRCIHDGYASVALIPIRANQEIVGLLQLNNREKDSLTPAMIRFFEGLTASIGVALMHRQAQEEKAKLEIQLRESQKMDAIGQLAGGISHDFNNLLSVINGYSQMLLEEPKLDPELVPLLEEISRAGERASSLIRQLLVFSRRQPVEIKAIDLDAVISGMEKMLRRLIRENILVTRNIGSPLSMIKADPGNIEQVIMNLVVNACDAMPDGGNLIIETRNVRIGRASRFDHPPELDLGTYVVLTVSDTGCGIDDTVREHIFEPFFTTKEIGKGTGLGLATVYGIVKQSNAYIDVQSEPGKGATFRIYFPQVAGEVAADGAKRDKANMPCGSETILIAEDDDSTRTMVNGFLKSIGYDVLPARSGDEALDLAKKHKGQIHLLLTDIVMPGMNGFELAKLARELLPGIKLLFMSGYTSPTDTQQMMRVADRLIEKPISVRVLAVKLREILDK